MEYHIELHQLNCSYFNFSLIEIASQYRSVSEENPKIEKFFEDTGRGEEMCSSPRVSAHWKLKHDWEVDSAPTVFQRVVKWEEPDTAALVRRPTGVDLDDHSEEKSGVVAATQTIRPSPCFTAVPRGKRASELFSNKESIPPVGFYNPRDAFVLPKTNISTKFIYPKACEPRTPLSREQIHAQYTLSRPSSAAGNYSNRPITPALISSSQTAESSHDDSRMLATKVSEPDSTSAQPISSAEPVAQSKDSKLRSRSPSPSGSWFFNKSDRIICAEPMYREAITPKEEYNVGKGYAMIERRSPGVSLKVVGRDDRTTETFDRVYAGAWEVKRRVSALPMGKTTGRDRPASGSAVLRQTINSVDFVEALPFTSERSRPASVDLKRMTGRNAPVLTKLQMASSTPVDAVYNPQINFVRQRFSTPVPFAKLPGRSPPRHFSAATNDAPLVYDSLGGFEFVAPRSKSPGECDLNEKLHVSVVILTSIRVVQSFKLTAVPVCMSRSLARPSTAKESGICSSCSCTHQTREGHLFLLADAGANPRYDWTEAFYKSVERSRSPVNMQLQLARPSVASVSQAGSEEAVSAGRSSATLTRSKRPATAAK